MNWYRTYTSTIFRQESQLVINYFNKITDTSLTSMAKSFAAAAESTISTGPLVDISVPISPVTPLREDRVLLDPASKIIDLQSIFYLFTLGKFVAFCFLWGKNKNTVVGWLVLFELGLGSWR